VTVPTFSADAKPVVILDQVGRWLSNELGFRWVKSRQALERRRESQIQELGLHPSKWNRSGVGTWVSPRVSVFDTRLAEWRAANPEATASVVGGGRYAGLVYTTLLINVLPELAQVELSGLPQPWSETSLATFRAAVPNDILPVVELFAAPASLPTLLPEAWVGMVEASTLEWLIATAGRDQASDLLRRHLETPYTGRTKEAADGRARVRAFQRGWEALPNADGRESVRDNFLAQLGWLSRVHRLVSPRSLRPRVS
jgi:hypothetical protein